jgi:hypothetical protein
MSRIPKVVGRRRKTSVALDDRLWRAFRVQALREGRPSYEILDQLVRAYLKKQGVTV